MSELVVSKINFNKGRSELDVYGAPVQVATVTAEPASGVTGTRATLAGTIDAEGVPLTECFFEYGETQSGLSNEGKEPVACPASDSSPHRVEAEIGGLVSNGHTYYFRLVALDANGREESAIESFATAPTVVARPAAPISTTEATLNGYLRPEGEGYSSCYFEYGISTNPGFERRVPCTPRAEEVPPARSPQPVSAELTGLQAATAYRFRLVATSEDPLIGPREGEELSFTTQGPPRITDVAASDADQGAATLEGKVNPSGFATSYRFEWGPTSSYGNRVPSDFEPYLGDGETPVRVTGRILGLSAGSAYHYRIVATSPQGVVASPDHVLETPNSCGLPEGRCYELVSRADAGPVAVPGLREGIVQSELGYQVSPAGGAVAYPVESGYPEARSGRAVLYRGLRASAGWASTELSPPLIAQSEVNNGESETGPVYWLSDDLSCGFLRSTQPLTADPGTRPAREAGYQNLYRLNADGAYTAVTSLAPEKPEEEPRYRFIGASQDCHEAVFTARYRYRGVPVPNPGGITHVYLWDEGLLRAIEVGFGPEGEGQDRENVVSADGSRVFFSEGRMLEDGAPREYAVSETGAPAEEVKYQWANREGSRVFFTARAGLTEEASGEGAPEGTDLYEYDVATGDLSDRTVIHAPGGAQVAGFVAATEDGSAVYFGSQARLVPGRGPTLAQNEAARSYSIYRESGGALEYAGASEVEAGLFVAESTLWTSQTSADGRYLLFQSARDVTGYRSGGAREAYLFDADGSPGGATTCVSCRQDGQPSVAAAGYQALSVAPLGNDFNRPRFLVVREGRPVVFFSSADALAPGATVGQNNIYEWSHDQVFRLASAPQGAQSVAFSGRRAIFAGASADGTDVYLSSPEALSPADRDGRSSVFDARLGGGFPQPAAPRAPCTPGAEGSCLAPPQGTPPSPGVGSGADRGAQNFQPKKKCKKKKGCRRKKKARHRKGRSKGHDGGRHARPAGEDRRAGK